jgi:hypothetical protein
LQKSNRLRVLGAKDFESTARDDADIRLEHGRPVARVDSRVNCEHVPLDLATDCLVLSTHPKHWADRAEVSASHRRFHPPCHPRQSHGSSTEDTQAHGRNDALPVERGPVCRTSMPPLTNSPAGCRWS